jgi:hypothetical protein
MGQPIKGRIRCCRTITVLAQRICRWHDPNVAKEGAHIQAPMQHAVCHSVLLAGQVCLAQAAPYTAHRSALRLGSLIEARRRCRCIHCVVPQRPSWWWGRLWLKLLQPLFLSMLFFFFFFF